MEIYDIAKKLLGPIDPAGETNTDERRFENLKETIELVDKLVFDIFSVSLRKDSQMHSVKMAGLKAHKYLNDLKEELCE